MDSDPGRQYRAYIVRQNVTVYGLPNAHDSTLRAWHRMQNKCCNMAAIHAEIYAWQTLHVETFTYAWLHADHALDNIQATCAATSAWKRRPYAWQHIDHTRITCARKHTNHGNAEITRAETYARNTRVAIYKPRARRHVHGNIQTISVATYIRQRGRVCGTTAKRTRLYGRA